MEFFFILVYESVLYYACQSGNLDLVKYLISLNKVEIGNDNVFIF